MAGAAGRDFQRQRVYNAEGKTRFENNDGPGGKTEDIQKYVDSLTRSSWWVRAFGRTKVRVERASGTFARPASESVYFSKSWRPSLKTILHELAHVTSDDNHGPVFASHYLFLVGKVMGPETRAALERSFAKGGVLFHRDIGPVYQKALPLPDVPYGELRAYGLSGHDSFSRIGARGRRIHRHRVVEVADPRKASKVLPVLGILPAGSLVGYGDPPSGLATQSAVWRGNGTSVPAAARYWILPGKRGCLVYWTVQPDIVSVPADGSSLTLLKAYGILKSAERAERQATMNRRLGGSLDALRAAIEATGKARKAYEEMAKNATEKIPFGHEFVRSADYRRHVVGKVVHVRAKEETEISGVKYDRNSVLCAPNRWSWSLTRTSGSSHSDKCPKCLEIAVAANGLHCANRNEEAC